MRCKQFVTESSPFTLYADRNNMCCTLCAAAGCAAPELLCLQLCSGPSAAHSKTEYVLDPNTLFSTYITASLCYCSKVK
jgi:hypothetical protein